MMRSSSDWIDISIPLQNGIVHWPGDPAFSIRRLLDRQAGHEYTVSGMSLGVHTGTHMDAPVHCIPDGAAIDQAPFDACIGPCRVIQISDPESIQPAELERHSIGRAERILFRTRNSDRRWSREAFREDFVYVSHAAALWLADAGIRTVGVDYLSVGGFSRDGRQTHEALLNANVWIIEGLDLHSVEPGVYELICLPLRIAGADGAPARAILKKR